MEEDIYISGSLTEAEIHPEIARLAKALAKKHTYVRISQGASGIHIDIPDPEALETSGVKELDKLRLSINAEKYLGIGRYDIDKYPTKENREYYKKYREKGLEVPCTSSMKTGKPYSVKRLLTMRPLSKRLPEIKVKPHISVMSKNKDMVYDEKGNLIPNWVGETIPLTQLPEDHPAIQYVKSRGYDPAILERQMEACYCYQGLPDDRSVGRYWPVLAGGVRKCHQGRIILTVRMNGVRKGYQSRLIDKTENGNYYIWTDKEQWLLVRRLREDGTVEEMFPVSPAYPKGLEVPKYLNASGSSRNELLMGYDMAVKWNEGRPFHKSYCILCEGPMDAARLGPPAIAILGAVLSDKQASYLRSKFGYICTVMDNDAAGERCLASINRQIPERVGYDVKLPSHVKDAGDLTRQEAMQINFDCDPLMIDFLS